MPYFLTIRQCYHNGVRYKRGRVVNFPKDYKPPRHFIPVPSDVGVNEKAEILDQTEKADRAVRKGVKIKAQKAPKSE